LFVLFEEASKLQALELLRSLLVATQQAPEPACYNAASSGAGACFLHCCNAASFGACPAPELACFNAVSSGAGACLLHCCNAASSKLQSFSGACLLGFSLLAKKKAFFFFAVEEKEEEP